MSVVRIHTTISVELAERIVSEGFHYNDALELGAHILLGDIPHPVELMRLVARYQKHEVRD